MVSLKKRIILLWRTPNSLPGWLSIVRGKYRVRRHQSPTTQSNFNWGTKHQIFPFHLSLPLYLSAGCITHEQSCDHSFCWHLELLLCQQSCTKSLVTMATLLHIETLTEHHTTQNFCIRQNMLDAWGHCERCPSNLPKSKYWSKSLGVSCLSPPGSLFGRAFSIDH